MSIELANQAEQVDLDLDPDFIQRYVNAMVLAPNHHTAGSANE